MGVRHNINPLIFIFFTILSVLLIYCGNNQNSDSAASFEVPYGISVDEFPQQQRQAIAEALKAGEQVSIITQGRTFLTRYDRDLMQVVCSEFEAVGVLNENREVELEISGKNESGTFCFFVQDLRCGFISVRIKSLNRSKS